METESRQLGIEQRLNCLRRGLQTDTRYSEITYRRVQLTDPADVKYPLQKKHPQYETKLKPEASNQNEGYRVHHEIMVKTKLLGSTLLGAPKCSIMEARTFCQFSLQSNGI